MSKRLTTVDNPWNPFKDYDSWQNEDQRLGYSTESYLARVAADYGWNDELTNEEKDAILDMSIDTILENDFMNVYRIVEKP